MSAWMVSKEHVDAMVTVYLSLQDTRYPCRTALRDCGWDTR